MQILRHSLDSCDQCIVRVAQDFIRTWATVLPQVTLEELLVVPGPGEPPEALQQYLQLLAEAYRRTHALATKLQPIAGPSCNTSVCIRTSALQCRVPCRISKHLSAARPGPRPPHLSLQELADVVFAEALEEYTDLELAWLQRLYETRAPAAQGTLSLQLITDMSAWNREVTGIMCGS